VDMCRILLTHTPPRTMRLAQNTDLRSYDHIMGAYKSAEGFEHLHINGAEKRQARAALLSSTSSITVPPSLDACIFPRRCTAWLLQ